MIRGRNIALVLLAVAACAGLRVALAATGTVQLGTDARPYDQRPDSRKELSPNFGFAYFDKNGTGPDTCTTVDRNESGANLIAKKACAYPENAEIIRPEFNGTNVVQMYGRTGECLYYISGWYRGNNGTGPAQSGKWESELESNEGAHFVVYINQIYNNEDNVFPLEGTSAIYVEIRNYTGSSPVAFQLTQQPVQGSGAAVTILNDDGTEAAIDKIYYVSPNSATAIPARGLSAGIVGITARVPVN